MYRLWKFEFLEADDISKTGRVTISDVARRCGVSKVTVSYVLNGREGNIKISDQTKTLVREVADNLGYKPNAIAKALATGKMNVVTMAFPNMIVPHYARVVNSFERLAAAQGYRVMVTTVGRVDSHQVAPDLWMLLNCTSDAIVLVDMPELFKDEIPSIHKPVVAMGIRNVQHVDCVEVDLRTSATAAITHLRDSNPRRLAFFAFGSDIEAEGVMASAASSVGDPRAIAYCEIMRRSGRPLEIICGSHEGRHAKIQLMRKYVDQYGCPDAVFCYDDEFAMSAHHGLRGMGFRLPEDVLLVGCDGNEECDYLSPPVTTIVQPVEAMCQYAWEFLSRRLKADGDGRQHILLDAELVIRASSVRPNLF